MMTNVFNSVHVTVFYLLHFCLQIGKFSESLCLRHAATQASNRAAPRWEPRRYWQY